MDELDLDGLDDHADIKNHHFDDYLHNDDDPFGLGQPFAVDPDFADMLNEGVDAGGWNDDDHQGGYGGIRGPPTSNTDNFQTGDQLDYQQNDNFFNGDDNGQLMDHEAFEDENEEFEANSSPLKRAHQDASTNSFNVASSSYLPVKLEPRDELTAREPGT